MTGATTDIPETPRDRYEAVGVASRPELESQDSVSAIADLAVAHRTAEPIQAVAPGSGDELDDSFGPIQSAGGSLRSKAFVLVVVPAQHDLGSAVIQDGKERPHFGSRAMHRTRGEERLVPVS